MADLTKSTFSEAVVPTPSGSSDFAASSGGFAQSSGPGGGLVGSPFSQKLVDAPGGSETPNAMSGLPTQVTTVSVDGGVPSVVELPSLMDARKNVGS